MDPAQDCQVVGEHQMIQSSPIPFIFPESLRLKAQAFFSRRLKRPVSEGEADFMLYRACRTDEVVREMENQAAERRA